MTVAEVGELGDGFEGRLALYLWVQVSSWPWILVLRLNGHRLVSKSSLLSQRVLGRLGFHWLVVVVLRSCGKSQLFLGDVAIEGNFLTKGILTSLLNAKPGPFFFYTFWSQNVLMLYLPAEGEAVRHLVKSERVPYPIPVPDGFLVTKSPP